MDSRRWSVIQATFDELVELDEASQVTRLTALGTTDPELRAVIESLLEADAEVDHRLAPLDTAFLGTPPAATADPLGLAGHSVSHFRVLELLGAGGMGVVYRAQDTRLDRPVALKFLLPGYSLDAAAKTRFLREAHAAAALDHPHLCTIYDVGESEDGRLFLAMALYAGETLKARLARDGPLPVAEALAITNQIARGLGCIHAAGIVHRDLKPGNVMLLPDGTLKILDFGLAKARDQSTSETGTRFGTVAYMAPEQIRGQAADARADLWAVGVVLYEMLTGQKPFAGEHDVSIAHAIVHDEPLSPSTLRAGVPTGVEDVVVRLLQKDPGTRYAAVADLVADLAAVRTTDEPVVRAARPRRLHTRPRRLDTRWWVVTVVAVLVIGSIGGAAIVRWLRPPRSVSWYGVPLLGAEALAAIDAFRFAISPDGERLAYVGTSPDGGIRLWVRRRDQLHATPLAGTEGAVNPFFSPDGARLGFVTPGDIPKGSRSAIWVVSLAGGPPTMVTDSAVDFGGAAWGYDGYIYFDGHLEGNGIARVPETGGVPEPVTMTNGAKGEAWHQQPEPLPNGKGVLFVIARGGPMSQYDIAVVDLATRTQRVLIRGVAPRYAASGHLVYATATGTLMAVPFDQSNLAIAGEPVALAEGVRADLAISASGALVYAAGPSTVGQRQLVWVTRDGRAAPIDTAWRADFWTLALSPDGAALAVGVQEGGSTDLWIKRLDQGPPRKVTFEGTVNERPAWTPDGRAVMFVSNARSHSNLDLDLYLARADGSAPPRLLRNAARSVHEAEYSRDGKWLVYRAEFDLSAVRTEGDAAPLPWVATPFTEVTPRLSPDGHWLAYASDESGRGLEVYVRPFPNAGATKWQVSTAGGFQPFWSRSGRELFYQTYSHGPELVAASVLPGATFAIGRRKVLFSTEGYECLNYVRVYDVTPDGRRFVMIRSAPKPHDELIWVDNFFAELQARAGHARAR